MLLHWLLVVLQHCMVYRPGCISIKADASLFRFLLFVFSFLLSISVSHFCRVVWLCIFCALRYHIQLYYYFCLGWMDCIGGFLYTIAFANNIHFRFHIYNSDICHI